MPAKKNYSNKSKSASFDNDWGKKEHSSDTERRLHPRIKDRIFVFGWTANEPITLVEGITNNLSVGGVSFDTNVEIKKNNVLWLEIYLPSDYRKQILESLYLKARVIWRKALKNEKGSNKYRIGLRFENVAKKELKMLTRYVEDGFTSRK
ncbi:MAG: PilZ domain-containing protein [Candidatus Omnitrophica bacterium]|nr:PilZ domain-containing protein [Candidatus Omnitrophota bacterium]